MRDLLILAIHLLVTVAKLVVRNYPIRASG
jgi:hypothetical protein